MIFSFVNDINNTADVLTFTKKFQYMYFHPLFWMMNNKRFVDDSKNRHCVHVYGFSLSI